MSADCEIDDCGVVALGRCIRCKRAFCASHQGKQYINAPLFVTVIPLDRCWNCVDAAEVEKREAMALAGLPVPVEESVMLEWQTNCARAVKIVLQIEDPYERLVTACRYWIKVATGFDWAAEFSYRHMGKGDGSPRVEPVATQPFSAAFPEFWASADDVNLPQKPPPWNSTEIATWFVSSVRKGGIVIPRIAGSHEKGLFAGAIKGWVFKTTEWLSSSNGESHFFGTVIVDSRGNLRPLDAQLHVNSLVKMASILGIENPGISILPMPR